MEREYTPVTGIWQTVWLEPVAAKHIENIQTVPNIDKSQVAVSVETKGTAYVDVVEVKLFDGTKEIATAKAASTEKL